MAPSDRYTFDPTGDLRLLLPKPLDSPSTPGPKKGSSNNVQMIASSKHLILASSVFRAMLQHSNFLEGSTLASKKQVEIPLPDDDTEAFEIILNIIHGRTRKVPKAVDFGLLLKLAILVDKYEVHEPVEIFSEQWFNNVKHTLPTTFLPSVSVSWICVTWVFNQSPEFTMLTRTAILGSSKSINDLNTNDLPIPARALDDIQDDRMKAIKGIHELFRNLICTYRRQDLKCNAPNNWSFEDEHRRECDAMMLGCLEKIALDMNMDPESTELSVECVAYDGIVLDQFLENLSGIRLRSLCDRLNATKSRPYGAPKHQDKAHGVLDKLNSDLISLEGSVKGLDLDSYKARTKRARRG